MTKSNAFDKAIEELLDFEGGYVNDPDDRGGETKFGITKATARRLGYEGDMKNLTVDEAKDMYYKNYWKNINLHLLDNNKIAVELFDQAVNMGIRQAGFSLQESYNLLNYWQGNNDLVVDGIIGPNTIEAINDYPYQNDLLYTLNLFQGKRYIEIVKKDPSQEKFFRGWLQRTKVRIN